MNWDDGICWHLEQDASEAPDLSADTLSLAFVRDDHLHVTNGTVEDAYIDSLRKASYRRAERTTQRAILPQTFRMLLSRFPSGYSPIVLPRPPLIEVVEIAYIDGDGADQTMADFDIARPLLLENKRASVRPAYGESWPATRSQADAVTVTFRAGYLDVRVSPEQLVVPEDIDHGRLLLIGELYKQRSESVQAITSTPAYLRSRDLFLAHKVY